MPLCVPCGLCQPKDRNDRGRPGGAALPHTRVKRIEPPSVFRPLPTGQIYPCGPYEPSATLIVRGIFIGQVGVAAMLPPTHHVSSTVNHRFRLGGTIPVESVLPEQGARSPVFAHEQ
jgi:hypothetical protein